MVVLVDPAGLELDPTVFRWVTLGDLYATTAHADLLHMDARSVLGSLGAGVGAAAGQPVGADGTDGVDGPHGQGRGPDAGEHRLAELVAWVEGRGRATPSAPRVLPLSALTDWSIRDGVLTGPPDRDFEVVGVDVESGTREVSRWSQPLMRNVPGRASTLVVQRRAAGVHVLVQAARQVGAAEAVELLPSALVEHSGRRPAGDAGEQRRVEELAGTGRVLRDVELPEEGGRFLHSSTRHVLVELDPAQHLGRLASFRWIAPHQLARLAAHPRRCSIELRSLLSCLDPGLIGEGGA
jgi:oxidase EvaA